MKILPVNSYNYVANTPARRVELLEKKYDVPKYGSMPLNLHRNQISFGRSWEEHKSWGATLNPDGTTNFKFFTYPDTKKVYIEILNDPKSKEGIENVWKRGFAVQRGDTQDYDPSKEVSEITPIDSKSEIFELERKKDAGGEYFHKLGVKNLSAGQYYRIILVDSKNDTHAVKDPYSTEQKQVMSWSTIHDPNAYKWSGYDKNWEAGLDKRRISRSADQQGLRPVEASRIMKVNIPTFTKEGTFLAAKKAFKEIADKNLANAIELTPVENCFSKQWGYDGVDKFAINERLGTSNELKELVDYAHQLGLNVIMDMVPNHMGPDGNMLGQTGPYQSKTKRNDWGPMFNFEEENNRYVRDWMTNAALHWADEYHIDGIRFDMTSAADSDFALKQINAELNNHFPNVFTIAEDGRGGKELRDRLLRPITPNVGHEQYIEEHIDQKVCTPAIPEKIGFNSRWDFDFFHQIKQGLHQDQHFDIHRFDEALKESVRYVSYAMSHDEQGNHSGASGVTQAVVARLNLANRVGSGSEAERAHRAAHAAQGLLEDYATGEMQKMDANAWKNRVTKLGITQDISKEDIQGAYNWGIDRVKLGMSIAYTTPGPKMFFQGYEKGSLNYFKFFRDLSDTTSELAVENKRKLDIEKGYDTSIAAAYKDSNPERIKYNKETRDVMDKVEKYSRALSRLVDENRALQDGQIVGTVVHPEVHATHSKKGKNEIFAVKNFSDKDFGQYNIELPQGVWRELVNSDDTRYGGSGQFVNGRLTNGGGKPAIKLASSGVSVWERVG